MKLRCFEAVMYDHPVHFQSQYTQTLEAVLDLDLDFPVHQLTILNEISDSEYCSHNCKIQKLEIFEECNQYLLDIYNKKKTMHGSVSYHMIFQLLQQPELLEFLADGFYFSDLELRPAIYQSIIKE